MKNLANNKSKHTQSRVDVIPRKQREEEAEDKDNEPSKYNSH